MEAYIAFFVFMLCYLPWTNRLVYKHYHLKTFNKKNKLIRSNNKKTKHKHPDQLSSHIDLVASVNSLFILFNNYEDRDPAWFRKQNLLTMITIQLVIAWYRALGKREKDVLDWDNLDSTFGDFNITIEESFVNCDQWNWSEMKEEDIE